MLRLYHVHDKKVGGRRNTLIHPLKSSDMHEKLRRVNIFKVIFGRLHKCI